MEVPFNRVVVSAPRRKDSSSLAAKKDASCVDNRTRSLFTVWAQPQEGSIRMWVGTKVFSEFYPISEESVAAHLGAEGWRLVPKQEGETFLLGLQSLFQAIQSAR